MGDARGEVATIWLGWLVLLVAAFNCVAVWIGVTFSSYHGHAWLIIGWGAYVGFLVVMLIASVSLLRHPGDAAAASPRANVVGSDRSSLCQPPPEVLVRHVPAAPPLPAGPDCSAGTTAVIPARPS